MTSKRLLAATVLVWVLCFCLGDPNSTEDEPSCEAGSSCHTKTDAGAWRPFKFGAAKWVETAALLKKYAKWHNKTLYDGNTPCEEKRAVVFKPNAGLGDSIGAISSAFIEAVKTGRLFFIEWQPYPWSVGLKPLPFVYDYGKAKKLKDLEMGKPLLCVDRAKAPGSRIVGHLTTQHPLLAEDHVNDVMFPYDDLIQTLIQPSKKVLEIIDSAFPRKTYTDDNVRMVSLVIRTGRGEYNQFLTEGDEINFVKCVKAYAKSLKGDEAKARLRIFVTSDVDDVKQSVVRALEGAEGVEVLTLRKSNVHVMHLSKDELRTQEVRDKLRKTYAEFFLIAKCRVHFLTHGSLFGRTAAEHGSARESDIHFISDSQCDGHREKYSYLECHKPKYPKICGLD